MDLLNNLPTTENADTNYMKSHLLVAPYPGLNCHEFKPF